jgi:hypothetical protein
MITVSCDESNETVEKDFCLMFNDAMLSFQKDFNDTSSGNGRTYSMIFFSAITSIPSQANDLHHPIYRSSKLLQEDLEKWKDWYRQNKSNWTKRKADSVMLIFSGEKSDTEE